MSPWHNVWLYWNSTSSPSGNMKTKKAEVRTRASAPGASGVKRPPANGSGRLPYFLAALAALVAAFIVYGPSLHGAFQFDDTTLPFTNNLGQPFRLWVNGLRPVL